MVSNELELEILNDQNDRLKVALEHLQDVAAQQRQELARMTARLLELEAECQRLALLSRYTD